MTLGNEVQVKDIQFLVVDDDQYYLDITLRYLKQLGAKKILWRNNGKDAADLLEEINSDISNKTVIDCVLCDWVMPKMSGMQFFKKTKQENLLSENCLFLMTTSIDAKESIVSAIHAGVNGYIIKPFEKDQLVKQVKNAFEVKLKNKIIFEEK